jgi:DNA modification methylase
MAGAKADLCFTSPPYGQQRDYTAEGKAKVADWDGLMRGVFGNLPMSPTGQVLVNLGLIHREGEWIPYWDSWIEWMREQGWRRFGWYVWDQGSGLPGEWSGRFAPSHEWVFHFNRKAIAAAKTVPKKPTSGPMGSNMRSKDRGGGNVNGPVNNVCDDPNKVPDSVVRVNRNSNHGTGHPATFPVPLPTAFIQCWSGVVYEPFCGSGTTLIAAEQLGRKCFGMEISPQYCDVIVKRWETLTGRKAVRNAR